MNKYHLPSFATLLADVGDCETNLTLTRDFNELVRRLEAHAEDNGTAAGSMAITVGVSVDDKGKVSVSVSAPKITLPKSKLPSSTYYLDTNGDGESVISKRNPKQRELFEASDEVAEAMARC